MNEPERGWVALACVACVLGGYFFGTQRDLDEPSPDRRGDERVAVTPTPTPIGVREPPDHPVRVERVSAIPTPTPQPLSVDSWTKYTPTNEAYTLSYPSGWFPFDFGHPPEFGSLIISSPNLNTYISVHTYANLEPFPWGTDSWSWTMAQLSSAAADLDEEMPKPVSPSSRISILSAQPTEFNGERAFEIEHLQAGKFGIDHVLGFYSVTGGSGYAITATAHAGIRFGVRDVIAKLVHSFSLNLAPGPVSSEASSCAGGPFPIILTDVQGTGMNYILEVRGTLTNSCDRALRVFPIAIVDSDQGVYTSNDWFIEHPAPHQLNDPILGLHLIPGQTATISFPS